MQWQSTKWIREGKAFFRPLVSILMYATYATILFCYTQTSQEQFTTHRSSVSAQSKHYCHSYPLISSVGIYLSIGWSDRCGISFLSSGQRVDVCSFLPPNPWTSYRHVDQHLHAILNNFQHASTSSHREPRNGRYRATKSKKLPEALYTISPETMSNCSS